jgi:LysR family transcriptional regulator, glycine cleavage system transcriptional activator
MDSVPPLRAVQAFEAVGRLRSITAAADELGVSPSAITQQVHLLERHLSARLIQRNGRGIELTTWGTTYQPFAAEAMEQLRRGGREVMRARRSNHLTVSALPSLTNRWLAQLLFDWMKLHPKSSIHVDGSDAEPRLEENDADFRISYGARLRYHRRCRQLFTDYVFPVASPALFARIGRPIVPKDLLRFPLLWTDWGPNDVSPPDWRDWFAACGVNDAELTCELTYSLSSAVIDAAVEGRGLALAQHSMVATALASGTLIRLFDRSLPLAQSYFLAWNGTALDRPNGADLHAWLINEARRFDWQPSG